MSALLLLRTLQDLRQSLKKNTHSLSETMGVLISLFYLNLVGAK
jgi:hypothetical protein